MITSTRAVAVEIKNRCIHIMLEVKAFEFAVGDGEVKGMIKDDPQVSGFSVWENVPFMEMGKTGTGKV